MPHFESSVATYPCNLCSTVELNLRMLILAKSVEDNDVPVCVYS